MSNLTEKINAFSSEIVKTYVKGNKRGENIMLSPLSLFEALLMLSEGAGGRTKQEAENVLGAFTKEEKAKLRTLDPGQKTLQDANALAVSDGLNIKEEYKVLLEELYGAEILGETTQGMAEAINGWVKEHTLGMIDKLVEDSFSTDRFVLLNAVAFKADWAKKYNPTDIEDGTFYEEDGKAMPVTMLRSKEKYYIEDDLVTGFLKPYAGENFTFMGLLPKEGLSPEELLGSMEEAYLTKLFFSAKREPEVKVSVPEFKADFSDSLKSTIRAMGMEECFADSADFSGITDAPSKVDDILHKTHIEVDRNGTKAAAATGIIALMACAPMPHKSVRLDRPFVYAILHEKTGIPVFAGTVYHVESN